jgi:hypothetical protein
MIAAVPIILFLVTFDQFTGAIQIDTFRFKGMHHPSRQSTNARRGLINDLGMQSRLLRALS